MGRRRDRIQRARNRARAKRLARSVADLAGDLRSNSEGSIAEAAEEALTDEQRDEIVRHQAMNVLDAARRRREGEQ